jgi:hypothetical protein
VVGGLTTRLYASSISWFVSPFCTRNLRFSSSSEPRTCNAHRPQPRWLRKTCMKSAAPDTTHLLWEGVSGPTATNDSTTPTHGTNRLPCSSYNRLSEGGRRGCTGLYLRVRQKRDRDVHHALAQSRGRAILAAPVAAYVLAAPRTRWSCNRSATSPATTSGNCHTVCISVACSTRPHPAPDQKCRI